MTGADTVKGMHIDVKRCPDCGTGFGVEATFCPFDGIALEAGTWDPTRDPLTGTVVDRRYEVMAPLGEGGMGTVYKVRHVTLDRLFAMKVLRRDLAKDAGLAARFMQEARATAAIVHPSVVAITDFGELAGGSPYFVMELLVGETLATRLRGRGLLPPREAASIATKLAQALAAAHAAGVVHRDLKPENVFLVGTGPGKAASELRIVDFGAAKIMGGSKLTRPGVVFGTPYYMSPEQASGQPVDSRADIYSLGVLLYEMITGAVPFEADTYMGVLTKHMFASPMKPSERAAGVQLGALEDVVLRALQKEPSARYASMTELAEALDRAVEERTSVPVRLPSRSGQSGQTVKFTETSAADRIQRSVTRHVEDEARRKRRSIAIATVAAVATLGLSAFVIHLVEGAPKDTGRATATLTTSPTIAPAPASTAVSVPASESAPAPASASASAPAPTSPVVIAAPPPRPRPPPHAPIAPASAPSSPPGPLSPPRPSGAVDPMDPWRPR